MDAPMMEPRLHQIEMAQAKIFGWATGGAFVGGLAWQLVTLALSKWGGV